jgi:putative mycofactocin binding protein MftB
VTAPPAFDSDQAWSLHPKVAIRPEPFGALAYHYDNRRLNFLRSTELVDLLESLGDHPSARAALADSGIDRARWPAYERALAALAASEVISSRTRT